MNVSSPNSLLSNRPELLVSCKWSLHFWNNWPKHAISSKDEIWNSFNVQHRNLVTLWTPGRKNILALDAKYCVVSHLPHSHLPTHTSIPTLTSPLSPPHSHHPTHTSPLTPPHSWVEIFYSRSLFLLAPLHSRSVSTDPHCSLTPPTFPTPPSPPTLRTHSCCVDVPVVVQWGGRVIHPVQLAPHLHSLITSTGLPTTQIYTT